MASDPRKVFISYSHESPAHTHRIGRRQHLADANPWWPRFTSLLNTPIQGSCAEVTKLGLLDIGEKLKARTQLVSCVHDEIIVECDAADAEMIMAEVQAIMETRSAQIFNDQKIGVEAHVEDNRAGVKLPIRSTFPKKFETKSLERLCN